MIATKLIHDEDASPFKATTRSHRDYRADLDLVVLAIFTTCYFAVTGLLAHRKLLWTDELLTYYLARLPAADLWAALTDGPEQMPPLGHFSTWTSFRVFGESHIASRLPAMLGFWVMSIVTFAFVRRYTGRLAATIAMCLPVSTLAFQYAFEARPYGLLLGFSALALYSWREACQRERRTVALLGVVLSLVGAFASHWFAVLLLIPLGLGEFVRLLQRRRHDWTLWGCLAIACLSIALWFPMIKNAQRYRGDLTFGGFNLDAVWGTYLKLFQDCGPILFILIAPLGYLMVRRKDAHLDVDFGEGVAPPVAAALAGLCLLPVFGALLAIALRGQYDPRYVIPTVIGPCVFVGVLSDSTRMFQRWIGGALLAGVVSLTLLESYHQKIIIQERVMVVEHMGLFSLLDASDGSLDAEATIVIPGIHAFLQLSFYSPPALARRYVYVADYSQMGDAVMERLIRWQPFLSTTYADLVSSKRPFYILETVPGKFSYSPVLAKLVSDGATISDSGQIDTRDIYPRPGYLFRVTW